MYIDTAHVDPPTAAISEEPPSRVLPDHRALRRDEFWRGVPAYEKVSAEEFRTHAFQNRHTITNPRQLKATLGAVVPGSFYADLEAALQHAPMALRISPYLLSLIDWHDPLRDPIRTQFLPLRSQQQPDHPMLQFDSLHEQEDSPVPGLTHRYRDKALFLPQLSCPVYCRFCTRSYAVGNDTPGVEKLALAASLARWEQAFTYIANQPDLEDIVISGGDSYNLKPEHLQLIGERLLKMPNIRRIRYATKGLCVLPQKILSDHAWTDALTRVVELGRSLHKDVVVHTHFNHPAEITGITQDAMNLLVERGIHVRCQTVLQRTVNDDPATMTLLARRLSYVNVHPYYVYMHDMVPGVEDLRTPLSAAQMIEKHVRGATAGFNTPSFVLDAPGGGGKRDVHSPEHYDRATGISVFTSPSVKPGKEFLYFDPLSALDEEHRQRWAIPAERRAMIASALGEGSSGIFRDRRMVRLARSTLIVALLSAALSLTAASAADSAWPQFRGPGGLGLGSGEPPVEFGPEKNILWKIDVPHGHSSPCIVGDRIFLTGLDDGKLVTLCVDRADGHELWRAAVPAEQIEPMHRIASAASPTPCTDGKRVYVYFGSFGLLAYDLEGREQWRRPMPVPIVEFGTGTSPILVDGKLILICDQDVGSYLLAVDAFTGELVWRVERPEFLRGFSSPFLWKHDGTEELVVAGSLRVKGYAVKDGRELWSCDGMARVSNATPVAGEGMLLVSSWNVGGDDADRVTMAPFDEFLAANDRNHDGVLTKDEFPPGPVRDRFSQMDVNKDGQVTREEYENMRAMFSRAVNQLFAIRPGGRGDITGTHVLWNVTRHLPYVSSPLCYNGRVYAVQNGGMASCYDALTGRTIYQAERMDAPGDYYSSAIGVNGCVYVASQKGTVVVIDASSDAPQLRVLARNVIGEQIFATPAILDGRIYLRTEKHLFAFGEKPAGNE